VIFSCVKCNLPSQLTREDFVNGFCCSHCNQYFEPSTLMQHETVQDSEAEFSVPVKPGDKLDVFEIDLEIGRGSFGSVFRAKDLVLNRIVALKIPRNIQLGNRHIQILLREASLAAKLRHPNIVAVYEVRQSNNFAYVVSEFIDGVTLKEMNSFVNFEILEIATVMQKLSLAIHYAHSQGVIHRDLKPANIIIDRCGEPHITDFGTAIQELPTRDPEDCNSVVGTPAYMAPEQAFSNGERPRVQLDVYSLGAILYELLCGELYVCGDGQIPHFESNNGLAVPLGLQEICKKALAYEPANRYSTAAEMANELLRFSTSVSNRGISISPSEPLAQTGILRARNWWKGIAAGIGAFALLVCSIFFMYKTNHVVPAVRFEFPEANVEPLVNFELVGSPKALSDVERVTIHKLVMDSGFGLVSRSCVKEIELDDAAIEQSAYLAGGVYEVGIHKKSGSRQVVERLVANQNRKSDKPYTPVGNWKAIEICEAQELESDVVKLGPETLYRIEGGAFQDGSDFYIDPATKTPLYPMREVQVADFYVAKTEVSVGSFEKVMGYVPSQMQSRFEDGVVPKDVPVTNVSYAEANEYCERIGARLPCLVEFLYIASNKGTTIFPWGNNYQPVSETDLGRLDFENDVTLLTVKISDLYSGVLEWTRDINLPTLIGLKSKQAEMVRHLASESRVVVGGTLSEIKSNDAKRIESMKGVRCFGSVGIEKSPSDYQGFRVYW